jgi:3-(3-hydroxy-phenyl)propionate hydroxylase
MDIQLSLDQIRELIKPISGPDGRGTKDADVLVVGAGPVGLTVVNILGSLGISTILLERNELTSDLPKALVIDDEYLRLLDNLDLLGDMEEHLSPPFGIFFYSARGKAVVKVNPFLTSNGFGNRAGLMQPVFEKKLLHGAQRFPCVDLQYRSTVAGLDQDENGVRLKVVRAGREHRVTGRFVLACDGARSFIRSAVSISFAGNRIDQPHLVVDLAEFPDRSPFSRFFCNPERPFNSVPTPYGGRRLEFMLNPGEDHHKIATADSIRDLVDRHTPYKGTPLKIIRSVVYGFSERIAERMGSNRVFLLGDSAHVMPPFGAQAMNTGARDANNICWKIAAVLQGRLNPTILETYETERRPQVEAIIRYSVMVGRMANIRNRIIAAARDAVFQTLNLIPAIQRFFAEMRYMPRPWIKAGFMVRSRRQELVVGRTCPRVSLFLDGGSTKSIDAISEGRFLVVGIAVPTNDLLLLADSRFLSPQFLSICFNEMQCVKVSGVQHARPASPEAEEFLRPLIGRVLLVRPDRYVAAVSTLDGIGAVLAELENSFGPLREDVSLSPSRSS